MCPFLPSEHSVTWRLGMACAAQGWFHPWPGDLQSPSCLRPVPVAWSSAERPGRGRWGPASPGLQLPQPSGSGHREGTGSTCSPLWALALALAPNEHRGHGAERRHQLPRECEPRLPTDVLTPGGLALLHLTLGLGAGAGCAPPQDSGRVPGRGGGAETSKWIMKQPPPWGGICCLPL